MFVLALVSAKLSTVGNLWEKPLIVLCLQLRIYQTLKLNSWIQAIHQITKALDKSIFHQFNYAIKTLASIFRINPTLYSH